MGVIGVFSAKPLDMSSMKEEEDDDSDYDGDHDGKGDRESDVVIVCRFLTCRTGTVGATAIVPFEECRETRERRVDEVLDGGGFWHSNGSWKSLAKMAAEMAGMQLSSHA